MHKHSAHSFAQHLNKSVTSCLTEAQKHKLSFIAIPAISCCVFGRKADLCANHHHMLDPVLPHRQIWPDSVWSSSLPNLAILFDHMHHPLTPVHFSSSHSILALSTFVLAFLFLYYCSLQILKLSLSHFHLLSSKLALALLS